jgi:hypothetical protein
MDEPLYPIAYVAPPGVMLRKAGVPSGGAAQLTDEPATEYARAPAGPAVQMVAGRPPATQGGSR